MLTAKNNPGIIPPMTNEQMKQMRKRVRLNLVVPSTLRKNIKVYSASRETSINEFCTRLLGDGLRKAAKASKFKFY